VKMIGFKGGIHPADEKALTADRPFEEMPPPAQVVLPLLQHLGKQAQPLVKKGEQVARGQLVAAAAGPISAPIHTPVSGKVLNLQRCTASGVPVAAITIQTDPDSTETCYLDPLADTELTPETIRERVAQAGIVGMGGAAFPTAVKLIPPEPGAIDLVILNGCECEPYLTRDYRLMLERPAEILAGLRLALKALGVTQAAIGIEDNKPQAIQAMRAAGRDDPDIQVVALRTRYPQGAEKLLVQAISGRRVPPGKLPLHVGVVVVNVSTAAAMYEAVYLGRPAISAAITASGRGLRRPKNLLVPIGAPIRSVLEYCGGVTAEAARVVAGGPLMGTAQFDLEAPVLKATSGILVLTREEIQDAKETACLKCGQCIEACPMLLAPTTLVRLVQRQDYDQAEQLGIAVCMECGTCAYTCPANVPLVQWLRLGKQKAMQAGQAAAGNGSKP
jgi:Na+-translocating ferredoxin:NAD+ oxidoreductase subunit C